MFRDAGPVVHRGAAQGVHPQLEFRAPDGIHVDDVPQVADIGAQKVVPVRGGRAKSLLERSPRHPSKTGPEESVCLLPDPISDLRFRRAAVRRVVLETTVVRRVVRGGYDYAVGQPRLPSLVVGEDRVGDHRGRGVLVSLRDHDLYPVRREDFHSAGEGRHREGVRIETDE